MAAPVRPTRPLRRTQLSDDVAAYLRGAVMSGRLRPGAFVRLDETATELGVSVTPVREALLTSVRWRAPPVRRLISHVSTVPTASSPVPARALASGT